MTFPLPQDEQNRLRALGRYVIFDAATQQRLSRTLRLAANVFDAPVAAINFVAERVVWCKVHHGARIPTHDREQSFCAYTIVEERPFVVEDVAKDERFSASPLLKSPWSVRFYAGSSVRTAEGNAVACLALYDTRPRKFSDEERDRLHDFAALISEELQRIGPAGPGDLPQLAHAIESVAVHEAVSAGFSVIDQEGLVIFANPAFARVHGYEAVELVDRPFSDLVPAEARERSLQLHTAFFAGAPMPADRVRALTRDREVIDLTVADRIAELPDGRRFRVMTILQVHEEEAAPRPSTWREQQYRYVINNARDIIFQTDDVGRWIFLNEAWERITGYSAEESTGRPLFEYLHPEDREPARERFARFIREGKTSFSAEWRVLTLRSGIRWIELQADRWTDAHGSTLGTIGIVYDITGRREAESSVRRMEQAQDAVASVSDLIMHYESEESQRRISGALEAVGLFTNADRTYLVQLDAENRSHRMVAEWCSEGREPLIENFREMPAELMPWYSARVLEEGPIIVPDVNELPPEASSEKQVLQAKAARALISVPLVYHGEVCGYVACERARRTDWSPDALRVLKICGEIMLSAIRMNEVEDDRDGLKRRFDLVTDVSTEYIAVLKDATLVEFMAPALERALKVPPHTFDDMPFTSLVHKGDRVLVRSAIDAAASSGKSRRIRFRAVSPELEEPVSLDAEFFGRADEPGTFVLLGREAAPGYKVQEIFGRAERRFQEIVERVIDLVVIFNEEGRVRYINPTAEAALGTPVDRLIATLISDWIAVDQGERWQELRDRAASSPGEPTGTQIFTLVPQGGRPGAFALSLANLLDNPAVGGYVLTGVALGAGPPGAPPAERPGPSRESVLSFLANISHEIRTPLSGILGFAGVLAKELEDPHKEFATMIEQSGKRLMDTLNSVLDLARLESDKITPRFDRVNVIEEARDVIELLKPLAAQKNLSLELIAHEDAITAEMDRAFLHRILHNLVGNAIKFTHSGGVDVSVSSAKSNVRIEVRDTGIGMSEEYIARLFEEFSQEHADLAHLFEGTGLGLAITRRLVNALNGDISVSSRKGEGTTFTVLLPGIIEPSGTPEVETPEQEPAERPAILVVDDNRMTRILVDRVLGSDHSVDTTATAEESIELARQKKYDLVILDIALGEGPTGEDLLQEMRRIPGYERTPFLAMTAYALAGDRERFLNAGFDYYLGKPFTSQELSDTVDRILASSTG